jgi:hypothetical protein
MMDAHPSSNDLPARYQFLVRGILDAHWAGWFDALTITYDADGNSLLVGMVADQAALYGVISRLRDLGLTLLAIVRLPAPADSPD